MAKSHTYVLLALACVLLPSVGHATVHVRSDAPPGGNGASWAAAFDTVQEGLDAADPSNDEVWVKAGTYHERIVLRDSVPLYGGFAGTETLRSQRNWTANRTTIDGDSAGSVVWCSVPATLDGFTIRNGSANRGGGIRVENASPTITNCVIAGNYASYSGGGISLYRASPVITNCLIVANSCLSYGAGIACHTYSSPTITNCTFADNSGAEGGALHCLEYSSPAVTNCIFAFNSAYSGGCLYATYLSSPTIANSDFWENGLDPYVPSSLNPVGANGNLGQDPAFLDRLHADYRLSSGSPCIDKGSNSAPAIPATDFEGQARIYPTAGVVDMGADEYHLGAAPVPARIVYVRWDAPPGGGGSSWASAHQSIQEGLDDAAFTGAEVWVKDGTYSENVALRPLSSVYGGFGGSETSRSQRFVTAGDTVISAAPSGSAVVGANACIIDGFQIAGGRADAGGGIYCSGTSPTVSYCIISKNTSPGTGAGVFCYAASPHLLACRIAGNSATYYGGGLCASSSSPKLTNCIVDANSAQDGGGAYAYKSSVRMMNCTLASNSASSAGGGVSAVQVSSLTVTNTILAYNSAPTGGAASASTPAVITFSYSDAWSNGTSPFQPTNLFAGAGNMGAEPEFVSPSQGDYRLSQTSPCMDAATPAGAPSTDYLGNQRPFGPGFDMGAYEFNSTINLLVGRAKQSSDGTSVNIQEGIVTAAFDGFFYLEQMDRSSGLRVQWTDPVSEEAKVTVTGSLTTDSHGEKQLVATLVGPPDTGQVQPIGMSIARVGGGNFYYQPGPPIIGQRGITGGTGLNNIGLLVCVMGKVSSPSGDTFYVSDASLRSGQPVLLKVRVPAEVTLPAPNLWYKVTGVVSLEKIGSDYKPLLLIRGLGDVQPMT